MCLYIDVHMPPVGHDLNVHSLVSALEAAQSRVCESKVYTKGRDRSNKHTKLIADN